MKYLLLALLLPLSALGAGKIINADIAPSGTANIALNKLAASTAHNVCTFDNSGFIAGGVAPGASGHVLTSNGTDWVSSANTAALSVGALDAQAANATGLALVANVLSTQSADSTHPGMVNNTTQTLSGAKTFSSDVTATHYTASSGDVTTPSFFLPTGSGNTGFYFGVNGATFGYNGVEIFNFASTQFRPNKPVNINFTTNVSTPGLYLLGESSTGFYRIGANNWGFTVSGSKVLDISSTGLGITGALNVSGTTTLDSSLTGVARAAAGVISASELSGDITTSGSNATTLKNTGAGAGSCTNCSVTFDAQGRETAYSSGTAPVTSLTVASANGFAGSFSASTTPVLTLSTSITGILSGNGTAISAASTTGSGSVVLATSPTIVTPTIAKIANLTSNGFVTTSAGDGTLGVVASPLPVANTTVATQALTTCTTARTVDWSTGNAFTLTLTSGNACTLTFSNPTSGQTIVLWLTNGAAGGTATVVWPTAKWFPAGAPVMTTGTAALDVCTCTYNGTSYACNCLQNGG